jgi:hypothetical protein
MWPVIQVTLLQTVEAVAFYFCAFFAAGCGWYVGQRIAGKSAKV